jgi:hypothetical protein
VPPTEHTALAREKFDAINGADADAMCRFFLKSFIFELGDSWKDVPQLLKDFRKQCKDTGDGSGPANTLNIIQASDFLQKQGKTRTAAERKAELSDVDIDSDGRITFLEYLLLHYKPLILTAFAKRYGVPVAEDLSAGGVGVVGVGHKLVDELLTFPSGGNPEIEAAIEEFMQHKEQLEEHARDLEAKAAAGGVKGLAATQELAILSAGKDDTELNRIELTLQAALRKARKAAPNSGEAELNTRLAAEAAAAASAAEEKRAAMEQRMAMFGGRGTTPPRGISPPRPARS